VSYASFIHSMPPAVGWRSWGQTSRQLSCRKLTRFSNNRNFKNSCITFSLLCAAVRRACGSSIAVKLWVNAFRENCQPTRKGGWSYGKIQERYYLVNLNQQRGEIGYASLTADAAIPLAVWWSCEKT